MSISEGTRVRLSNDPSKVGVATGHVRDINGRRYRTVDLGGGKLIQSLESNLMLAHERPDALSDLIAGKLAAPDDLARLLTHIRLTGSLSDMIYSMESTNTDFHAYQFKPIIKLLNSAARGLLIADEVGLGKTIEAGLIWTEISARYQAGRLLVVCPKSLQEKWRLELLKRFAVKARVADAREVHLALKDAQESSAEFALIATYSALRAPRDWREGGATSQRASAGLARFLEENDATDPLIDLLVFDEAHHLRNPETSQHRLARHLVPVADHKLMLSATPINLGSEDLRSLLRLLEPDLFESNWIFEEMQAENEPIVHAREMALNSSKSLTALRDAIAAIEPGRILKTDRRLANLQKQILDDQVTDTPERRAHIAASLEEMSLLGGIVNRTRRRDVAEIQIKRRAVSRLWAMNETERAFYGAATQIIRSYALQKDLSDAFLLANTQRVLASCLPAAWKRWRQTEVVDDIDEDIGDEELDRPASVGPLVAALSAACRDSRLFDELRAGDSKYNLLRQAFVESWAANPDEKIIVFSSFRGTVDYLEERLVSDGVPCIKLHGNVKEDRGEVLERFRKAIGRCVLLVTEVGSEGLDLQFCRVLVNYDLPWNPMRVEQRIGRIDRIGQASPSVEIFSLVCERTIEESIYRRLYERLDLIERTLGGFEPILGEIVIELQRRVLDPRLSPEDIDREIERAAVSAQNRKVQEDALEEEAPGLIAHGDMILNRIRSSHDQKRWIGPEELYRYVRSGLTGKYPNSSVDRAAVTDWQHEVKLCAVAHHDFRIFLEREAKTFPTQLRRQNSLRVAFGRSRPVDKPDAVEVVHTGHPLVRFVGRCQQEDLSLSEGRPAVWGRLYRANAFVGCPEGKYGLAVQRWSVKGTTPQDRLVFAGIDLADGQTIPAERAEELVLASFEGLKPVLPAKDEASLVGEKIRERIVDHDLLKAYDAYLAEMEAAHQDKLETNLAVLRRKLSQQEERVADRLAKWKARADGRVNNLMLAERAKLEKFKAGMEAKIVRALESGQFDFQQAETLAVMVVEVN